MEHLMRLDHINLCATDVAALTGTLSRHFAYEVVNQGTVPDYPGATNPGSAYAFLVGQDASSIVISEIAPVADGGSAYPSGFHFGLIQDSADAVHAKHAELIEAGYAPGPISAGFEVLGATWTAFYCEIGDGLEIEVNHRTASAILDRNS
jgi:hypothetical protein